MILDLRCEVNALRPQSTSPIFEEVQELFVDDVRLLLLAEVPALGYANAAHAFGHLTPYIQEVEDTTVQLEVLAP